MKAHKIIPLIASLLLIGTAAIAQPVPRTPRPPAGPGMRMMHMLNLTKEQQDKLTDMHLQMMKEMLPLRTQIQTLRSDLKLALTADNFDQKKVDRTVDQISDVRKQMTLNMVQHLRDVRNILTPDQQKKFDLMIISHRHGNFGWRDGMMSHRRGTWGSGRMAHFNMQTPRNK